MEHNNSQSASYAAAGVDITAGSQWNTMAVKRP